MGRSLSIGKKGSRSSQGFEAMMQHHIAHCFLTFSHPARP